MDEVKQKLGGEIRYTPKLDVIFQTLFGEVGSEKVTKKFVESILEEKFEKIDLSKNQILRSESIEDKMGILDVVIELEGKINCDVEMQVVEKEDLIERLLFYWSKMYIKGIKKGEEYSTLKRTIVILIADFEVKSIKELEYHTKWKLIEEKERKVILTDKLEIHIIELPKLKGREEEQGELLDWLFFISNPSSERVKKRMEENEELKEAKERLEKINQDEKMQRIAELRDKAIRDEKSAYSTGFNRGIKDGKEQGIAQGREEGREQGKKEEKLEIAKKLLKRNMQIKEIATITNLPEEEIQKLKE